MMGWRWEEKKFGDVVAEMRGKKKRKFSEKKNEEFR